MKQIIFFFVLSSFVWSNIGNVGAIKGSADLVRDMNQLRIKSGMVLKVSDKIMTKEKSRIQAILKDNTVITIGENTIFVFDAYRFGNKDDSKVDMHIERGFFRSLTGQIGKLAPNRFNIKTVSTTIGIRGTDFSAFVTDAREVITCHSGKISVLVEDKTYNVNEGQQLILVQGKKKKKSSDDDLPSFSVTIVNSMTSFTDDQNDVDSINSRTLLNNAQSSTNSMSALDQIDTGTLDEVNRKDGMAPLENPIVEFPDR